MKMHSLVVDKLAAGYDGRPVLEDFSLCLSSEERVAVVGPNGCGKSTLLRAVTAEISKDSGRVLFCGIDITEMRTDAIARLGFGYLRQDHNVFPGLSVEDNVRLAASGAGNGDLDAETSIFDTFPVLGDIRHNRAGVLSGGERQLLAVAMVLSRPIRILFLDEPVAGLSQKNATELLDCIFSFQRQMRFAVLMAEHRLKLIRPYVSRVIVMVRGEIAEDTKETEILEDRKRIERYYSL